MAAAERSASPAHLRALLLLLLRLWLWAQGISDLSAYPATTEISVTSAVPRATPCRREEVECFSKGELAGPEDTCLEPLSRGHCSSGQWFVLQPSGADDFRGLCRPQPCASGLLPFEGRCLGHEEARGRLCAGGHVHLDATGLPRCGPFPGWIRSISSVISCSEELVRTTAVSAVDVACAKNNKGNCEKQVYIVTPKIYIGSEE